MAFFAIYPAISGSGGGGGGIVSINGDTTGAQLITGGTGISVATVAGNTTITNTEPFTPGNLTDVGTDGITITGGTNAVNGAGTSIAQHVADTTHNGYLSSVDWNTFNNKQSALTIGNLTDVGTDGIVVTGGTGAVIGAGTSLAQHVADTTHNGYLSSTDWNTFNNKQNTLTLGNLTDVGTDGITITGGTGAVVGAGTAISQHVADTTHNGYLSSTDWNTFNNKGSGSVTSIDVSGGTTGLTTSGGPVTTSGVITIAGTLVIANGGTGQTTAIAAFDALSPLTTAGDTLFYDGTHNVRLPIGTTGQVLTVVTGEPTWSAPTSGGMIVNVRAPEGGGTVTFTVADNPNQRFDLTASETAVLPTTSVLKGDVWTIINPNGFTLTIQASDASNIIKSWGTEVSIVALINTPVTNTDWAVIETTILNGRSWASYTPTFTGFGTVSNVNFIWRRVGQDMEIHGRFQAGTTSAGAAGDFTLAVGLNVDTSILSTDQGFSYGMYTRELSSVNLIYPAGVSGKVVGSNGSGSQALRFAANVNSNLYNTDTANSIIGNNEFVEVQGVSVQIAEWAEV